MEIITSKCILRQWKGSDVDSLVKNANNINIFNNLRNIFPHPYKREDAEKWIKLNIEHETHPQTNFAIDVNGLAVGSIGLLLKEDVYCKNIEIGYFIGEDYWGRGIVTEAIKAITGYIFENFDCARIYAEVFSDNLASQKVLKSAGFVHEATFHKNIFKNNQLLDSCVYSILK